MPATVNTVKVPVGMRRSWYFPITAEADATKPTYGTKIDMGAGVKAYLSLTTASGEVRGDDIAQLSEEKFVSGQIDAETTLSDLEVNAKLYGHTYTTEGGEVSGSDDSAPNGGYAYIQHLLKKDKSSVFRAVCMHKVSAMASAEKDESDTKPSGDLSTKNYAVSFKVMEDNAHHWRTRKDFTSQESAEAFIDAFYGQVSPDPDEN